MIKLEHLNDTTEGKRFSPLLYLLDNDKTSEMKYTSLVVRTITNIELLKIFSKFYKLEHLINGYYTNEEKNCIFHITNSTYDNSEVLDDNLDVSYISLSYNQFFDIKHFKEKVYCSIKPSNNKDTEISLLYEARGDYHLRKFKINPILDLNLEENYNHDFIEINKQLFDNINTKKSSFNILHGLPGSGKTTYIKYLVSRLADNKNVVYLPPNVTSMLSSPSFIGNLELFKDKVVIIEDAEEILVDSGKRSQAISNILNITDGILCDIFNIHFIFTFNIDIRKIDPALLRKGRLTLKYEFKELESSKVVNLCKKLNIDYSDNKTLAEIYNSEDNIVQKENKTIGFN